MNFSQMIRVTILENRFEADLVDDMLSREGIVFIIRSYQDSAYVGLYQTQKGYAALMVDEKDRDRAETIVAELRASIQEATDGDP